MRYLHKVIWARSPVLAVLCAVSALVLACGGGGAGEKAEPTPTATAAVQSAAAPEQALNKYVEATFQKLFVEDCTKVDLAKDANKVCSLFKGERGQQRAYQIGPTGAAPNQWLVLENQGGQWNVVYTLALNSDNATVPGIPWPLRTGVDIVVIGANPCVNVREGPALSQKAVDCIKDGTKIRLAAGPASADGLQWWQVEWRTGWVVSDYLRYPDAAQ
jgi:hypothetical protein